MKIMGRQSAGIPIDEEVDGERDRKHFLKISELEIKSGEDLDAQREHGSLRRTVSEVVIPANHHPSAYLALDGCHWMQTGQQKTRERKEKIVVVTGTEDNMHFPSSDIS